MTSITLQIREKREAAEKSIQEVAEEVGVGKSHISMIERGERGLTLPMLVKLSDSLGCEVCDLFIVKKAA